MFAELTYVGATISTRTWVHQCDRHNFLLAAMWCCYLELCRLTCRCAFFRLNIFTQNRRTVSRAQPTLYVLAAGVSLGTNSHFGLINHSSFSLLTFSLFFPCVFRRVALCVMADPVSSNRGQGNPHSVAAKQDWQAQPGPPGRAPRLRRGEIVTCQEPALLLFFFFT